MAAYAASDPTAYVGQILSLVKENENISKAYIILNTVGTLQEIGTGTLEHNINTILLRLDPIEEAIENAQLEINNLKELVGSTSNGEQPSSGIFAELDKKANLLDVYTKDETDLKIGTAITEASHLKRKEVQSIDDINIDAKDADQYIYMVPSGLLDDDNKYYEYMVIEVEITDDEGITTKIKKVEQVGSWSVDLSVYAKKTDLNAERDRAMAAEKLNSDAISELQQENIDIKSTLSDKVNKVFYTITNEDGSTSQVEGTLLTPEEKDKLAALSIDDDGSVGISGTVSVDNVQGLPSWLTNNGATYIKNLTEANFSKTIADKLNFITSVDSNRFTIENGQLGLVPITTADITDFENFSVKINNLDEKIEDLFGAINNDKMGLTAVNTRLSSLEQSLENYVTVNDFNTVVGDLNTLLESNTTIIAQIDELNSRLTWHNLEDIT